MNAIQRFFTWVTTLGVLLSSTPFTQVTFAATTITGGGATTSVGKTAYVTLEPIVLTSNLANDFKATGAGRDIDIVGAGLVAGSELEFDFSAAAKAAITVSSTGTVAVAATPTTHNANLIRVNVTTSSAAGDTVTISGIQVRAKSTSTASGTDALSIGTNGGTVQGDAIAIDVTAPTLDTVTIASDNTNTNWAKVGDTVTVTIVASENLSGLTATINGNAATLSGSGTNWTASYTLSAGDTEGAVSFSLTPTDEVGNVGAATTLTTDASAVTFDKTAPTAPTVDAVTSPTSAANQVVTGTAEADALVAISGGSSPATDQLTGGDTSYAVTVPLTADATNNLSITASDAAGNVSPAANAVIEQDSTAPASPSVTINSGDVYTTATNVSLALAASDTFTPLMMKLSNNADLSADGLNADSGAWIAFSAARTWDFASGDGTKTVYVAFKDGGDNTTATVSDSIVLDTTAPTLAEVTPVPARTNDTTPEYTFSSDEAGTITYGGDCTSTTTAISAGNVTLIFDALAEGAHTNCTIQVTDAVGNASTVLAVSDFTIDLTAPSLTAVGIASDNLFDNTLATVGDKVTLSFVANEALSGATVTINGNAATVSGSGTAWTATYTLTATDSEGTLPFTIDYMDLAGNSGAQATAVTDGSAVVFDMTAPGGAAITILGTNTTGTANGWTNTGNVILDLSATDSALPITMMLSNNSDLSADGINAMSGVWQAFSSSVAWTLKNSAGNGKRTVYVAYRDGAGNVTATISDNITLDTKAPTVKSASVTPDPAKEGIAYITVVFNEKMDTTVSPTVTLTGLETSGTLATTQTSYINKTWSGTVSIPDNNEDMSVDINVSGAQDLAGNLMALSASAGSLAVDTLEPKVFSLDSDSMTYKLGDPTPQIITVNFDEQILTAPTVTVNSVSQFVDDCGDGDPTTYCFTYNVPQGINRTTMNVEISSAADIAGNVMATDASNSFDVDTLAPNLTTVTIASDNTVSTLAKVGDTVTLTFVADEDLAASPTVTIAGQAATVVGSGTDWTATYILTDTETEGVLPFSIQYADVAGNAGAAVTATTDSSQVLFDKTGPAISSLTGTTGTTGESTTVTVEAADANGIAKAEISVAGSPYVAMSGATSPFTSFIGVPLNSATPIGYQIRLTDQAGNVTLQTETVVVTDNDAPTAPTIVINGGASVTNVQTVTLALGAVDNLGVTHMQFSDDGVNFSPLEAFAATKLYTLPGGDGGKIVYVRYADAAGNLSVATSAAITLATPAPASDSSVPAPTSSPAPTSTPTTSTGTSGATVESGAADTTGGTTGGLLVSDTGVVLGESTQNSANQTPVITDDANNQDTSTPAPANDEEGQVQGDETEEDSTGTAPFIWIVIVVALGTIGYLFMRMKPPTA